MNNERLENTFNEACAEIKLKEPRNLWPGVRAAITAHRGRDMNRRPLWAAGFAGAAVVLILIIPGAAQSIKKGIMRIFSSAYSVQLGGQPAASGILISVDGETKEIKVGDMLLQVRVSSFDKNTVMIELSVYSTAKQPDGSVNKLISKPKIVTMKGKTAEIMVTDSQGVPVYKFRMTPLEDTPAAYNSTLDPIVSPQK